MIRRRGTVVIESAAVGGQIAIVDDRAALARVPASATGYLRKEIELMGGMTRTQVLLIHALKVTLPGATITKSEVKPHVKSLGSRRHGDGCAGRGLGGPRRTNPWRSG